MIKTVVAHLPDGTEHQLAERFNGKHDIPRPGDIIAIGRKVYPVLKVYVTVDHPTSFAGIPGRMQRDFQRLLDSSVPLPEVGEIVHMHLGGEFGNIVWGKKVKVER